MLFTFPPHTHTCPLELHVTYVFTLQSLLLIGSSWGRCLASFILLLQHLTQYLAHSRCPLSITGNVNAGLDDVGGQHPQEPLPTDNQ